MSHYENNFREELRIRLKHKKLAFLTIFLCLPILSIVSIKAEEPAEIDFLIFSYIPEEQMVINEIIESAESVGLMVNPIFITDWNYYLYLIMATNDWDICYGGSMNTYQGAADNIFNCAYGTAGYCYYYTRHTDNKYFSVAAELYEKFLIAQYCGFDVDDDFINDMYDQFHDCEERVWEKQYLMTLAQFVNLEGKTMQKILTPNCLPGHAFSDENLRLAFSQAIDRTVVIDYLTGFGLSAEIVYHPFGYSICHDTTLPNCLPN